MEDNYIMLRGKKVPLTEEQIAELLGGKTTGIAKVDQKADPFERGNVGDNYYYIDEFGYVKVACDYRNTPDNRLFKVANACMDAEIMEQRALHETMNRLLWRYSEQHGGDADWITSNQHFFIVRQGVRDSSVTFTYGMKVPGVVYFASEEAAEGAIKDIVLPFMAEHHGLMW